MNKVGGLSQPISGETVDCTAASALPNESIVRPYMWLCSYLKKHEGQWWVHTDDGERQDITYGSVLMGESGYRVIRVGEGTGKTPCPSNGFYIYIDGVTTYFPKQKVCGAEIKAAVRCPCDYLLYLEMHKPDPDEFVSENMEIDTTLHQRLYTIPPAFGA